MRHVNPKAKRKIKPQNPISFSFLRMIGAITAKRGLQNGVLYFLNNEVTSKEHGQVEVFFYSLRFHYLENSIHHLFDLCFQRAACLRNRRNFSLFINQKLSRNGFNTIKPDDLALPKLQLRHMVFPI